MPVLFCICKDTEKSENIIRQVASRNPEKPVFIVSPFCFYGDDLGTAKNGDKWRRILKEITEKLMDFEMESVQERRGISQFFSNLIRSKMSKK